MGSSRLPQWLAFFFFVIVSIVGSFSQNFNIHSVLHLFSADILAVQEVPVEPKSVTAVATQTILLTFSGSPATSWDFVFHLDLLELS